MLHPPALWMQQLLPAMKSSFNSEVSSREKLIFFSLSYISCTLSSKETLYFLSLQNNQHNSLPQLAAGKKAWNKKSWSLQVTDTNLPLLKTSNWTAFYFPVISTPWSASQTKPCHYCVIIGSLHLALEIPVPGHSWEGKIRFFQISV